MVKTYMCTVQQALELFASREFEQLIWSNIWLNGSEFWVLTVLFTIYAKNKTNDIQ